MNREEKTQVEICIPVGTPRRYRKMMEEIGRLGTKIKKKEGGCFYYNIDFTYYGNTANNLKKVVKLAKSGYVVDLNLEVLNHKVCLIRKFIDELRDYE